LKEVYRACERSGSGKWNGAGPKIGGAGALKVAYEVTFSHTGVAQKTGTPAILSHYKYSENSMTELRGNWWTSAILYAEHSPRTREWRVAQGLNLFSSYTYTHVWHDE